MDNYLSIANSGILFVLCLIPILFVLVQSIVFIRIGIKRTEELGVEKGIIKKIVTNSVISSILPSVAIIISLAALMPSLGKFIPWLRLSVIGSMSYETMAAEIAIKALGGGTLGDSNLTASMFASVVWVMCIGSIAWPLSNVIGLKFYDNNIQKVKRSGGFMQVAAGALFVGLMSIMAWPRLFNFASIPCIASYLIAGLSALLLDFVGKKLKVKTLSEFSFPLAMILGMVAAIISTNMGL